jgi:tRNA pseudouridine38-40 synthase
VRYRARVEYDGTDFSGFQFQPGSRTVQGEIEAALRRVSGDRDTRVEAAGRTDSGVHASAQLIAFNYAGRLRSRELARALDALLPRDVAIHDLRRASETFRPRYAASLRQYRYTIWNGPRSPLRERYALGVRAPLDVTAMADAASGLVGRRDFSAFSRRGRPPVRTLHEIRVRRRGRTITIDVVGEAFLRQMVRSIVAALLRVGRGEASAEEVWAALEREGRAFAGEVAPAHGLCLTAVVAAGRTTHTRADGPGTKTGTTTTATMEQTTKRTTTGRR